MRSGRAFFFDGVEYPCSQLSEYAKQLVRCFKAEILDDLGLVPGKLQKEIQSDGWDRRLV